MASQLENLHAPSNTRLWSMLPRDQADRVFSQDMCDIGPEFLGFVGIYERLAEIIPLHWTVVDLGCAYAPQAFFFADHLKYIGVDLGGIERRFAAKNTAHYTMPIRDFLEQHSGVLDLETTFAICSYVPPWGDDNIALARGAFRNVFTFYPAGGETPIISICAKQLQGT